MTGRLRRRQDCRLACSETSALVWQCLHHFCTSPGLLVARSGVARRVRSHRPCGPPATPGSVGSRLSVALPSRAPVADPAHVPRASPPGDIVLGYRRRLPRQQRASGARRRACPDLRGGRQTTLDAPFVLATALGERAADALLLVTVAGLAVQWLPERARVGHSSRKDVRGRWRLPESSSLRCFRWSAGASRHYRAPVAALGSADSRRPRS